MNAQRTLTLAAPAVLMIGIFVVVPLLVAVAYSFMTANPYGGVDMP